MTQNGGVQMNISFSPRRDSGGCGGVKVRMDYYRAED